MINFRVWRSLSKPNVLVLFSLLVSHAKCLGMFGRCQTQHLTKVCHCHTSNVGTLFLEENIYIYIYIYIYIHKDLMLISTNTANKHLLEKWIKYFITHTPIVFFNIRLHHEARVKKMMILASWRNLVLFSLLYCCCVCSCAKKKKKSWCIFHSVFI